MSFSGGKSEFYIEKRVEKTSGTGKGLVCCCQSKMAVEKTSVWNARVGRGGKKTSGRFTERKKIFAENMFYVYYSPCISLYVEVSVNISFEYLVI